jgi:hypothetical protein
VFPETKGVPLEEMDTVFGEGVTVWCSHYHLLTPTIEVVEEGDTERTSLLPHNRTSQ